MGLKAELITAGRQSGALSLTREAGDTHTGQLWPVPEPWPLGLTFGQLPLQVSEDYCLHDGLCWSLDLRRTFQRPVLSQLLRAREAGRCSHHTAGESTQDLAP